MISKSRRRVLSDLGVISASSVIGAPALAFAGSRKPWPSMLGAAQDSNPLYIIFSGPWLILASTGSTTIQATTVDDAGHSFRYFDSRKKPYSAVDLQKDVVYDFTLDNSYSPPTVATSLFSPMAQSGQGLIFGKGVSLAAQQPAGKRTVSLPTPNNVIVPAALVKASLPNNLTVSVDPNSVQNQDGEVKEWPSALLFIYSGWNSANLTVSGQSSELTLTNTGNPTHLEFRIQPNSEPDSSCDASGLSVGEPERHFAELMKLLDFGAMRAPFVCVPPCSNGINSIQVRRGDDANVDCAELGLDSGCTNKYAALHLGRDKRPPSNFVQLVNCASGGGGVLGCC